MTEYRLFAGDVPHVSTPEFHEHRERAPHLEQPVHRPRLDKAYQLVLDAAARHHASGAGYSAGVTDLGCGDGGLLSLLKRHEDKYDRYDLAAWGYDFQPSNQAGWNERGVDAELLDAFAPGHPGVILGNIAVMTEVLEHLADPHGTVQWVGTHCRFVVASSPWTETPESHDECHCWAWDQEGYRALIEQGGYTVVRHETVGQFQVILGERHD
ncbi:methyltransferase domain-containing protein [Kitasatospora sp. NPDC057223]|uniref:methyltransferase domain-containing protein n=1 Tax=Kitasatospora sp. NPDC057223 TaxID=3346055 RepID=UPI003644848F